MIRAPIVAARSDAGYHHATNQDALAVQLPGYNTLNGLYAVADGISSLPNSDESSRIALEAVRRVLYALQPEPASPPPNDPYLTIGRRPLYLHGLTTPPIDQPIGTADPPQKRALKEALIEANRSVQAQAAQANVQVMGTTIAGMFVGADQVAWVFSVGDSRVYRLRNRQFTLLTQDHIVPVTESPASADGTPPQRSTRLSMYIGQPTPLAPFIEAAPIKPGDSYLICSDGLWSLFSADEMRQFLARNTPDQAADRLLEGALKRGAPDNVSLIAVSYRREARRWQWIARLVIVLLLIGLIGLGTATFILKLDQPFFAFVRAIVSTVNR